MAIRTGKSYKVVEASTDGDGCGAVLASFSVLKAGSDIAALQAANERAGELAGENPGTRYFVAGVVAAVYEDRSGGLVRSTY